MYPDPEAALLRQLPAHDVLGARTSSTRSRRSIEDALNLILILHADHEQNCSTSTVRMVGSSQANLFASCAAGVCALWGPLHGGANVAVLEMLEQIHTGGLTPQQCIELAKDKNEPLQADGLRPPRLQELRPARQDPQGGRATRCWQRWGASDPLLDIARSLEELALKDPYFVDRKLYPNVDFYSGIILRAIGIPINMFTVMFAIGRMPGWIAHWKEQHDDASGQDLAAAADLHRP